MLFRKHMNRCIGQGHHFKLMVACLDNDAVLVNENPVGLTYPVVEIGKIDLAGNHTDGVVILADG